MFIAQRRSSYLQKGAKRAHVSLRKSWKGGLVNPRIFIACILFFVALPSVMECRLVKALGILLPNSEVPLRSVSETQWNNDTRLVKTSMKCRPLLTCDLVFEGPIFVLIAPFVLVVLFLLTFSSSSRSEFGDELQTDGRRSRQTFLEG